MHKFCIESGNIFCVFRNSTHPRVGYPNRFFCPSTRKWWMTPSYSKSYEFSFWSVQTKTTNRHFQKSPLRGPCSKTCVFGGQKRRLRVCGRLKSSLKKEKNSRIETDTCGRGLIQNTGKSTADWLVNSSVGWVPDFKTVGPDSILCQSNTQGLKNTKGVLPSLCL